jgi:hypothetical protein
MTLYNFPSDAVTTMKRIVHRQPAQAAHTQIQNSPRSNIANLQKKLWPLIENKREQQQIKSKNDSLFLNVARKDIIEVKKHYEALTNMHRNKIDQITKRESQSSIINDETSS